MDRRWRQDTEQELLELRDRLEDVEVRADDAHRRIQRAQDQADLARVDAVHHHQALRRLWWVVAVVALVAAMALARGEAEEAVVVDPAGDSGSRRGHHDLVTFD